MSRLGKSATQYRNQLTVCTQFALVKTSRQDDGNADMREHLQVR